MQNSASAAFFARQIAHYKVKDEDFQSATVAIPADQEVLTLNWYADRSALPALRFERNHIAIFAWRHLRLQAGQRLRIEGPRQERVLLLIEHLEMAAGSALEMLLPMDLVVAHCQAETTPSACIRITGADGAPGQNGTAGAAGVDGATAQTPGSAGGDGGAANFGQAGGNSYDALLSIGCLDGNFVFEAVGGRGGDGGVGGKGGKGGKGGTDPVTRKMAIGGNGGSGGTGGHGGSGGNGGLLRVWIQELAAGAQYQCLVSAAAGGAGGNGGGGGVSGLGHPDGNLGFAGPAGNAGASGAPGVIDLRLM